MATKKSKNPKLKKHRGVTLIAPSEKHRTGWQARWKDPDSGKLKKEKLPERLTTGEGRAEWCAAKLDEIKRRKLALPGGAVRARGVSITEAIEMHAAHNAHAAPRTKTLYREALAKFVAWCEGPGEVRSCDDLTRPRLMGFRNWLLALPVSIAAPGKKPGTRIAGDRPISATTANNALIKVGAVLRYAVDADLCPKLTVDDVRRALTGVRGLEDPPRHLSRAECRALLEAAIAHDASGKHRPIASFVLFTLCTGMRADEARQCEWAFVSFEGTGDVRLPARVVKTRRARDVTLDVSPCVLALLEAMHTEGASGSIFALDEQAARYGLERLIKKYGAPDITWQVLRSTCGTYLTCAPAVYGAGSVYMSARRLGHSVAVAEKSYLGQARGIPREARTLEAAMGIEDLAAKIVAMSSPR